MNADASLRAAMAAARWIERRWPDLMLSRFKGTPRPWQQPAEPDAGKRAAMAHRDRLERQEVTGDAPGETPAPLHVSALDVITQAVAEADALHDLIAQVCEHPALSPAVTAFDDPRRFLAYIRELLPEASRRDQTVAYTAREVLETIQARMSVELREITDGQVLYAVCPFCLGKDDSHPVGGGRTLRIRVVPASRHEPDSHTEAVVRCEGGACNPLAAECGLWLQGMPAWRWHDWDWLAQRLISPQTLGAA